MSKPFYLVREVNWWDGPTLASIDQARKARLALAGVLGEGAIILSSDANPALYLAEKLAEYGGGTVYSSNRIREGGRRPYGIRSLYPFVQTALAEAGVQMEATTDEEVDPPIIVVTHQPLMSLVAGRLTGWGEVIAYQPDTWQNTAPAVDLFEDILERTIASHRSA